MLCKTGYSLCILTRVLISLTHDHKSDLLQDYCCFVAAALTTETIIILKQILDVYSLFSVTSPQITDCISSNKEVI